MAFELIYTSVPRGLRPGVTGFCTVAHTAGMSPPMIRALESVSSYPMIDAEAGTKPPLLAHWHLRLGVQQWNVLSRLAPAGVDHTRRPNFIAHHVVLEPNELPPMGPAAMLRQMNFCTQWTDRARLLENPPELPRWEPERIGRGVPPHANENLRQVLEGVDVVIAPDDDALEMAERIIAALPQDRPWDVTFYSPAGNVRWPEAMQFRLRFVTKANESGPRKTMDLRMF